MRTLIPYAVALSLVSTAAMAQTTSPTNQTPSATPPATAPSATPAPQNDGAAVTRTDDDGMTMSDEQASGLVDKGIHTSDDENIGEVAAVQRDATGKVTELHADIGGFLGLGETRVRLMPSQFKVEDDRVLLNMTADQARNLPKIEK